MRRDGTGGDTDASLANGTESTIAFSGWHARVFASMECRSGHAGQGFPADRVTAGLSMLTLRVSMATRTHRRGVQKRNRRVVSLTRPAPVEKRQNKANFPMVLTVGRL